MNPKITGKGNKMVYDCDDTGIYIIRNSIVVNTSATVILNGLVEVSQTKRKATLIGFGHGLSILNVYSTSSIDLPNGVFI